VFKITLLIGAEGFVTVKVQIRMVDVIEVDEILGHYVQWDWNANH
jgi:hypothetical protein